MKELTLQIKPVGNHCNLECSYCYAKPFKGPKFKILPLNLLEKIIKEAVCLSDSLIISWHGGEPTLVGLDYFKEYINILNKYKKENQMVLNMIQTNATLIDDDLAKFFKENDFIVSISLDGNRDSHNKNRYYHGFKGSFDKTMEGVNILRKNGIFPPVIATVSKSTYDDGVKNFMFFIENGFTEIKYSPVYDSSCDNFSIDDDKWFLYLKDIFDKWLEIKNPNIKIREIDEILMWHANKSLSLCSSRGMCANWISIDCDGNIYPCEYLRNTNPYGNIESINLSDVFKLENYNNFKEKVLSQPLECQECKLFDLCHNGCPATRVKDDVLIYDGKYVYCGQRRKLFEEIQKILT